MFHFVCNNIAISSGVALFSFCAIVVCRLPFVGIFYYISSSIKILLVPMEVHHDLLQQESMPIINFFANCLFRGFHLRMDGYSGRRLLGGARPLYETQEDKQGVCVWGDRVRMNSWGRKLASLRSKYPLVVLLGEITSICVFEIRCF